MNNRRLYGNQGQSFPGSPFSAFASSSGATPSQYEMEDPTSMDNLDKLSQSVMSMAVDDDDDDYSVSSKAMSSRTTGEDKLGDLLQSLIKPKHAARSEEVVSPSVDSQLEILEQALKLNNAKMNYRAKPVQKASPPQLPPQMQENLPPRMQMNIPPQGNQEALAEFLHHQRLLNSDVMIHPQRLMRMPNQMRAPYQMYPMPAPPQMGFRQRGMINQPHQFMHPRMQQNQYHQRNFVPMHQHHQQRGFYQRPDFIPGPFPFHRDHTLFYGWMTERDRQWLLNFQNDQVKTENPYQDDFYNINYDYSKRVQGTEKFGDASFSNDLVRKVILPFKFDEAPMSNNTKIVEFAGCLGRIAAASIFYPRELLDLGLAAKAQAAAFEKTRNKHIEMFLKAQIEKTDSQTARLAFRSAGSERMKWYSKRSVLLHIENLHVILLEIITLNQKLAGFPCPGEKSYVTNRVVQEREVLKGEITRKSELLLKSFKNFSECNENEKEMLQKLLSIKKGQQLVVRMLVILDDEWMEELLLFCMLYFVGAKKDEMLNLLNIPLYPMDAKFLLYRFSKSCNSMKFDFKTNLKTILEKIEVADFENVDASIPLGLIVAISSLFGVKDFEKAEQMNDVFGENKQAWAELLMNIQFFELCENKTNEKLLSVVKSAFG